MVLTRRSPKLGLALGSGSARGWAHIGVLRALEEAGIRPDVVCGSSIGALVGAAYAAGELQRFSAWVESLGMREVFGFMDFNLGGGMLKGEKLIRFWQRNFADFAIEKSPTPFGAVATDLHSGAEVWLRQGSIADAVRASIALPGLFTPVRREGRLLIDGGLVNPVPVSLARAMGADIVIAVDLNADILHRHLQPWSSAADSAFNATPEEASENHAAPTNHAWSSRLKSLWSGNKSGNGDVLPIPSVTDVVMTSITIMQMRITRSRLAGDPPELVIAPRLSHMSLLDFHRASESIAAGYQATKDALPSLAHWIAESQR